MAFAGPHQAKEKLEASRESREAGGCAGLEAGDKSGDS